jgi:hypothetical protein
MSDYYHDCVVMGDVLITSDGDIDEYCDDGVIVIVIVDICIIIGIIIYLLAIYLFVNIYCILHTHIVCDGIGILFSLAFCIMPFNFLHAILLHFLKHC